ncbi:AAA family ATPase [Pseudarthrobacter oxydans]|uniref:AAA family ATPase n=1 Tax=Micrococcaceae TaxID=1268 RepID=UPI0002D63073|nr:MULTISPECIES: AAA family ATPase [unclassified Arthrobacter]MBE0011546.1 ATP-binding protein [Arthrobacter sp. AET 35A]
MRPTNAKHTVLFGKDDDGRRFLTGDFAEVNDDAPPLPTRPPFLSTREHRRFTEFADAVRTHRYIGLCWGPPGIGKTLSARHYAAADDWEQWHTLFADQLGPVPPAVLQARTAFFTPTVAATVRQIDTGLPKACQQISFAVDYAEHGVVDPYVHTESRSSGRTELLIIDEADRLKATGLEQVRDYFDRHHMGVILIGMPGIEKRLARYPQLYSRIGFAHEYRPLTPEELTAVLTQRLPASTTTTDPLAQTTAIATIVRITAGNFRLVDRLITQIQRIQALNNLDTLTPEVVDAAREALLIGH